jgi:hypothetical protein
MAKQVLAKNGGTLTRYEKGERPKGDIGRPKKYITLLKERGYNHSQVIDTYQIMLSLTIDELKEIYDNPQATILEKIIASGLRQDLKTGKVDVVETIINRTFGKPKENIESNVNHTINVVTKDESIKNEIDKL